MENHYIYEDHATWPAEIPDLLTDLGSEAIEQSNRNTAHLIKGESRLAPCLARRIRLKPDQY